MAAVCTLALLSVSHPAHAQTVVPVVVGVEVSSDSGRDGTYVLGESIWVAVTFSEAVTVSGTPQLRIDMDPAEWGEKAVPYAGGSGTATLAFAHVVVEPNLSTRGIAVLADSLELNGGSIRSVSSGADAALSHVGLGHDPDHKVDWHLAVSPPSVAGVEVSSVPATGDTYLLGESISVAVSFSEPVVVDTAGGTPELAIDMDPAEWGEKAAPYAGGSGTRTLTFVHVVVEPNFSTRGIAVLADSLGLNGGSISSVSSGADAVLSHAGLGHDPDHRVDWRRSAPDPNQVPVVAVGSAAHGRFGVRQNAPRGMLVSKPFHGIFSDPDGDELTYSAAVTGGDARLVDLLQVTLDAEVRVGGLKRSPVGTYDRVFFRADSEADWKALTPRLPARPVVTVTLTATDPGGLSASVSGDFEIRWETYPELDSATAAGQTVTLTYDMAVSDDPAPAPGQFTVNAVGADGSARTVAVSSVRVVGEVVTLGLASPLGDARTATLDYAHASRTPLRAAGGWGDPAPRFRGRAVTLLPGAVGNFSVTVEPGDKTLLATWDPVDGAADYRLRWRPAGGEFEPANASTVADAAQFITVADFGSWEVQVQACNDAGCGPRSITTADAIRAANLRLERPVDDDGNTRSRTITATWDEVKDAASYTLRWQRLSTDAPAPVSPARGVGVASASGGADSNPPAQNELTVSADRTEAEFTTPDDGAYEVDLQALGDDSAVIAADDSTLNQVNSGPDRTPPWLVRGEMDGDRVYLYFSEPLNENVVGGRWHPYVQLAGCECVAGGIMRAPTEVSGNKVTVRFGGQIRAVEGGRASISYWVYPRDVSLRDLAGNRVRVPYTSYDGSRSTGIIRLHNITGRPYVVPIIVAGPNRPSGVAFSSDAGGDRFYMAGDVIRVAVRFSEAVEVTGTPRVRIDLDPATGGEKWADYASGSGTQTLVFAYTVAEGDSAAAGVAVLENSLALNGGAIRSASAIAEEHARLGHGGLGHDLRHRVLTPSSAAPVLSGASVNGTSLTLTFSESLGAAASLANSAFTVKKSPQSGAEQTVSLSGSPSISGTTLTLTLASAVLDTDVGIKVSYAKPSSGSNNKLADAGGAEVGDFADRRVVNALDTTKPTLVRGEIEDIDGNDDVVLTLYFSEPLDEHSWGAADVYKLVLQWMPERSGFSFFVSPRAVTVSGHKVVVEFTTPIPRKRPIPGQVVLMSYRTYRDSPEARLRDLAGNPVKTRYSYQNGQDSTGPLYLDNLTD